MCKSFILVSGALCTAFLFGCMAPDVEPQQRIVTDSPKETMSKDFFEAATVENKELGNAKYYHVFNNLPAAGNYSVTVVELDAGGSLALRQNPSNEMIIVYEGSGMLKVNDTAYILKKGQFVFIPGNSKQSTLNNGNGVLRYISMFSPAYDKKLEVILAPPPPPLPLTALKDTSPSDDINPVDAPPAPDKGAVNATESLIGKTPMSGKKTIFKDVQGLTQQEQSVPSVPALNGNK
jgi:quercetin dioxygenase-like cupin family protein